MEKSVSVLVDVPNGVASVVQANIGFPMKVITLDHAESGGDLVEPLAMMPISVILPVAH